MLVDAPPTNCTLAAEPLPIPLAPPPIEILQVPACPNLESPATRHTTPVPLLLEVQRLLLSDRPTDRLTITTVVVTSPTHTMRSTARPILAVHPPAGRLLEPVDMHTLPATTDIDSYCYT